MARGGVSGLSMRARLGVSAAVFLATITVLFISFAVTPEDIESGRVVLSPTCHFKLVFGRECWTCGMTRAFTALSHGRLTDALAYNRGAPLLYGLAWLAGVGAAASLARVAFGKTRRANA
ncbi:MAG: DUF2752 domain-containing protein [Myxococcales bacterium]|nr:DUF2752 domain-containing protein [Myxococcales bacterium]